MLVKLQKKRKFTVTLHTSMVSPQPNSGYKVGNAVSNCVRRDFLLFSVYGEGTLTQYVASLLVH